MSGVVIVCKAWYVRLANVESLLPIAPDMIQATVSQWIEIDMVKGSPGYSAQSAEGKAGEEVDVKFSASVREHPEGERFLVRIDTDTGDSFLIGDLDLPVKFERSKSLGQKTIAFSHSSWHFPYKIQL